MGTQSLISFVRMLQVLEHSPPLFLGRAGMGPIAGRLPRGRVQAPTTTRRLEGDQMSGHASPASAPHPSHPNAFPRSGRSGLGVVGGVGLLMFLTLLAWGGPAWSAGPGLPPPAVSQTLSDDELLDLIQKRAFDYFVEA